MIKNWFKRLAKRLFNKVEYRIQPYIKGQKVECEELQKGKWYIFMSGKDGYPIARRSSEYEAF